MLFYEGLSCPVCKRAFQNTDDIVACPQCGLPHHRACWQTLSHCQQADKHGTDEQWSQEKAREKAEEIRQTETSEGFSGKICVRCHTRNKEFAEFCTHCGCPLPSDDWHSAPVHPPVGEYTPFHSPCPSGEIYTETERIGSATAKDVAAVVATNTAYYMPRFRLIYRGERTSWNWAAALLSPYWLMFRKQYVLGVLFLLLDMAFRLLGYYWAKPAYGATSSEELMAMMDTDSASKLTPVVMGLFGLLIIAHVLVGLYGNLLYKRHCERVIEDAKEKVPDITPIELTSLGGTSMAAPMLCYFITNLIVNTVTMMLTM